MRGFLKISKDMPWRKRSRSRVGGKLRSRRRRRRFESDDDGYRLDSPSCLVSKSLMEVSGISYYDGVGTYFVSNTNFINVNRLNTDEEAHHRCVLDIYGDREIQKKKLPVLIYVHGGSWRVGHRRAWLFAGQHPNLAEQYDCKVVSIGYRRCRMRLWVFYGLYPLAIYLLALCVTVPIVLPFTLFQDAKLDVEFLRYISLGPAVLVSLLYYLFWGLYPRGGGNFESQLDGDGCNSTERTYETCAYDISRAVRFLVDHSEEYGLDTERFYLVGHSAGAHLISVVATNPKFLAKYNLNTSIIKGVAGLAGPYSPEITYNKLNAPFRWVVYFMSLYSAFASNGKEMWNEASALVQVSRSDISRASKMTWCLLHGQKDMPMFDVQMKQFARAIRDHYPRDTVITRTVKGKGHSKMATDLGSPHHDTMSPVFTEHFKIHRRFT